MPVSCKISLLLVLLGAVGSCGDCITVQNRVLGSEGGTYRRPKATSVGECCRLCSEDDKCVVFTFEANDETCYLKSDAKDSRDKAGAVSGYGTNHTPTPAGPTHVTVGSNVVNTVSELFKCWNIDASANRGFFVRTLSDPYLHNLGRQSQPGVLRFGGTGNDDLVYCLPGGPSDPGRDAMCLNETWFLNLVEFSQESGAQLLFGLNDR